MLDESRCSGCIKGLKRSKAPGRSICNQVSIARDPFGTGGSLDQWDGYPEDRVRLLGRIERAGMQNVVFLTGDAHVFLARLVGSDFDALASRPEPRAGRRRVRRRVGDLAGQRPRGGRGARPPPWIQQYNGLNHGYALMTRPSPRPPRRRVPPLATSRARAAARRAFERFVQPAGANR